MTKYDKVHLTEEQKAMIRKLKRQGLTKDDLRQRYGCSMSEIDRALKAS